MDTGGRSGIRFRVFRKEITTLDAGGRRSSELLISWLMVPAYLASADGATALTSADPKTPHLVSGDTAPSERKKLTLFRDDAGQISF